MANASYTQLSVLCAISEEEAQCYLHLSHTDLAQAYFLFLLAQENAPLTMESVAKMNGIQSFELSVSPREDRKEERGEEIGTGELTRWKSISYSSLLSLTASAKTQGHMLPSDQEKCTICMCDFAPEEDGGIVRLGYCSEHYFHKDCIEACRGDSGHVKCPVCGRAYGIITGDMPGGKMTVVRFPRPLIELEGFSDYDTIVIQYAIPSGLEKGVRYSGTTRTAFFPATEEGLEVVRLLMLAFERRLTFAIGTSVTTGKQNAVVWNGIHHKTNVAGGATVYGYPDPSYFFRVKEELLGKGLAP